MSHWTPYSRNGDECRFCSNPPFPLIRNGQDVADYCACFDARWPPLWTKLAGLVSQMERATRHAD